MVQEFHVLRCFSCESFQVQQVKKVNRWTCKVCGEKQSLLKEFGRGSGADCRRHVQKLNTMRGAMIEKQEHNTWSLWEEVEADGEEPEQKQDDQVGQTQMSRWNKYLDASQEAEQESNPEEDSVLMGRKRLYGNNITDRKKTRTDTHHCEVTPPAQSSCSSLMRKLVGPSTTTTSWSQSSPPSRTQSSPPSKKRANPCSPRTVPVSKWTQFLSSECQVQGGGLPVTPWSQPMNGATSLSNDVTRPRPPLPGSSLFETGEEFRFEDEDFLRGPKP